MLNILFARHKGKKWKVFDSADLVPTPPPLHFMATSFNLLVLEIFQTADFVKKLLRGMDLTYLYIYSHSLHLPTTSWADSRKKNTCLLLMQFILFSVA